MPLPWKNWLVGLYSLAAPWLAPGQAIRPWPAAPDVPVTVRIIALGERVHGTTTLTGARHDLALRLASDRPGCVVLLEAGLDETLAVSVAPDSVAAERALRWFYPVYRTPEYAVLLRGLKERSTWLVGFDQQDFAPAALLQTGLPCLDDSLYVADSLLATALRRADDGKEPPEAIDLTALATYYRRRQNCLLQTPPGPHFTAMALKLGALALQNRLDRIALLHADQPYWPSRDSLMAGRIFLLDSLFGRPGLILLAADAHLCTCPNPGSPRPAGVWLRRQYGSAYWTLAITGFTGLARNIVGRPKAVNFLKTRDDYWLFRHTAGDFKLDPGRVKRPLRLSYYEKPASDCIDRMIFYRTIEAAQRVVKLTTE